MMIPTIIILLLYTDVGTHNDGNGLYEGKQACIHKGNRHQRGSSRTLYGSGDEHTRENARETVGGHSAKDMTQLRTSHLLKGFTHGLHTEHEERERTQKFENNPD